MPRIFGGAAAEPRCSNKNKCPLSSATGPPAGIAAVACRSFCFVTPGYWERPQGATQQPLVEQAKGVATLAESPAAGKVGVGHLSLVISHWSIERDF
ncbi:hypothetical protein [uncultured Draconibacterium sp.]|uniref:hypothetical protein n=1 Tax=uncultured Draconibacterium sp. TaxID=1573823 RepID=UPI0029C779B3|nr:hypothetical protein [uncultured Draconibacterium sp.]